MVEKQPYPSVKNICPNESILESARNFLNHINFEFATSELLQKLRAHRKQFIDELISINCEVVFDYTKIHSLEAWSIHSDILNLLYKFDQIDAQICEILNEPKLQDINIAIIRQKLYNNK